MSFSWTGRQLDSITKSDGAVVSFTYDANGMRTEKTVGDETHGYVLQNGKLIAETYVNGTDSRSIYYIYDENGAPIAWSYLNEYYYYIKNQQGDILGFTDSEGNVVVTYEYDAWGNLIFYTGTSYLAEYNSLRYRRYAYDNETGLYYLQSRYYDPKVGRFLNADEVVCLGMNNSTLGYNLFSYCENNVINKYDPNGYLSDDVLIIVGEISVSSVFARFASTLMTAFVATIAKVSAYVTGVLTPKIVALFCWNPWVVAGVLVAATAIVVASVTVYANNKINSNNMNKTVEQILKSKRGSIKQAPLPPGGPHWNDILKKTLKEIKQLAPKGVKGYKEIYKLLTDARFNK